MSTDQPTNDLFNGGLVVMLLTLVTSLGMTFSVKQVAAGREKVA